MAWEYLCLLAAQQNACKSHAIDLNNSRLL
jgi:hypothetical protein